MSCPICGADMVLATESRGLKTERCSRGCDRYQYEETNVAPLANRTILTGILRNTQTGTDVSVQIVAMI